MAPTKPSGPLPLSRGQTVKFRPPRQPSKVLQRVGLKSAAAKITDHLITQIVSPAGYGKSTLMTSWRTDLISQECQTVWISIDASDNHPGQLIYNLVQAFSNQCNLDFERFSIDGDNHPVAEVSRQIEALALAIEKVGQPVVLFLDDLHVLDAGEPFTVILAFVANAPDNLSFVLASRTELPELRNGLLEKGLMQTVNAHDMAFDFPETVQFLKVFGRQDLTLSHVDLLHQATEGWVAGLHLACATLRNAKNLDESIRMFSGRSAVVSQFIWNNFIQDLSEDDRLFLERLALLDTFTPLSCDFILDMREAADTLLRLAARIPFIICLDEHSQTFRLHSLFREFLLSGAKHPDATANKNLHARAYRFYRDGGMFSDAIGHAFAADEKDKILDLVEFCARDAVSVGGLPQISSWINMVPKELVESRLSLQKVLTIAYAISRQFDKANKCIVCVRAILDKMEEGPSKQYEEREFLFLSAVPLVIGESPSRGLDLLIQSDFLKTDMDPWIKGMAANCMAVCYLASGDFPKAHEILAVAQSIHEDTLGHFRQIYTLVLTGQLAIFEGKIAKADAEFRRAVEFLHADEQGRGLPSGVTAIFMVPSLYERGRFDEIRNHMANRTQMAMRGLISLIVAPAMTAVARMRFALHQEERAEQLLDEFEGVAILENLNFARAKIRQVRAEQAIRGNRVKEFERILGEVQSFGEKRDLDPLIRNLIDEVQLILSAQHYIFLGKGPQIVEALEQRDQQQTPHMAAPFRLLLKIYLYLCKQKQDGAEAAAPYLTEAIHFGADLGYSQAFVDAASMFPDLLRRIEAWEVGTEAPMTQALFAKEILEAAKRQKEGGQKQPSDPKKGLNLSDLSEDLDVDVTLSPRESEILVLVAKGQRNRDIAESLGITLETVKWHLRQTYQKLDVGNRTQAVRAAERLRLIEI